MKLKAKHRVYPDIEFIYKHYKIKGHYKFENTNEIKNVLGFIFEETKGFEELSNEKRELVVRALMKILNGFGLEWRDTFWPVSLKDEPKKKRILLYCTSGKNETENSWIIHYEGNIE